MTEKTAPNFWVTARRYILLGLFTLIPLWLTLLLIIVILGFINELASPIIGWITAGVSPSDTFYRIIKLPLFQTILSLTVLVLLLYGAGWLSSRWLGQRLLRMLDQAMQHIPVASTIYKTIKRLADAVQTSSDDFERVVLIEFPSPNMKTVGLVTRTFKDSITGRELAAVYVPTTPNPTSGYLEIVPVENLVPTNWKLDEAMSFIISGGADVPPTVIYDKPSGAMPERPLRAERSTED